VPSKNQPASKKPGCSSRAATRCPCIRSPKAAREIVATIGEQIDVETVQQELAASRGIGVKEMLRPLGTTANFFKHADRDATATLDFDEGDAEVVLQLVYHDFGRITGGMPIEAQIYEAWVAAIAFPRVSEAPLRSQELIRRVIAHFPGIRGAASRAEQKKIGLGVLNQALADPKTGNEVQAGSGAPLACITLGHSFAEYAYDDQN
jgi:hypothetical protein